MKVYFYTLGCRVNQYETDAVRQAFLQGGYEIVSEPSEADVLVVNTCTVTSEADRKSRQQLRRMARLNPNAVICAMGCSAEMSDGAIDADVICGTKDKHLLVSKVEEFLKSGKERSHKGIREYTEETEGYAEFGTVLSPEASRAYIKVEDGCNNFCTYCIIPYARGRVVSRKEENVIKEVEDLVSKGIHEVCVTGIHVCSYGKDRGEDIMSLYSLIHNITAIEGVDRISLGSLEPKSLTDEFLKGLSSEPKLCRHFHLSLQSGSDTVLKRMNRHYNTAEFLEVVEKLRSLFPKMSLTTDIICGFPEETEEEFQETLEFVRKAGFNKVHVFPYSLRKGTKAAAMPQVPTNIARERAGRLIALSNELEEKFAASFVGSEVEVMVEAVESKDDKVYLKGYTGEYVYSYVQYEGSEEEAKKLLCKVVKAVPSRSEGSELYADI